jgi:hypothetical protein
MVQVVVVVVVMVVMVGVDVHSIVQREASSWLGHDRAVRGSQLFEDALGCDLMKDLVRRLVEYNGMQDVGSAIATCCIFAMLLELIAMRLLLLASIEHKRHPLLERLLHLIPALQRAFDKIKPLHRGCQYQ